LQSVPIARTSVTVLALASSSPRWKPRPIPCSNWRRALHWCLCVPLGGISGFLYTFVVRSHPQGRRAMNQISRSHPLLLILASLGADKPLIEDYVKSIVGPIPSVLTLDRFYKKHAEALGISVVSSTCERRSKNVARGGCSAVPNVRVPAPRSHFAAGPSSRRGENRIEPQRSPRSPRI
jgi:hypothetical protein